MNFISFALYLLAFTSFIFLLALVEKHLDPSCLPKEIVDTLSFVIDHYLHYTLPIRHCDGSHYLPSCPYRWPNGQGDAAKFLNGVANSAEWKKKYGNIYRIWSGTKPEIVLTQPHQLSVVFRDSNKHIKATANNSGEYMNRLLGHCVGLISGNDWRRVRSIAEIPFGHQSTSKRVAQFQRHINEHFQRLHAAGNLDRQLLHPADDMKMLPFWVVCEIFYGRLPTPLLQELSDLAPLRERIFRYVIQGGIMRFSLSQWLPTQANAELREFQSRWSAFNNAAWAHALEQSPSAPIVQLYEATMRGDMTKDELLQTLDESMYANLDVTTGGLSWNFVFLAAHPDVQKRVCSEVQTAVQENRLHSYLLSESTYLAACVLESSRLKPLAAFSVPQAAPSDREVDGYIIPRGTNYVVDAYALNIQSDTWAPDNAAYRPDRFLGRRNTDLRYRFWRFGFGPRQCMGKYVADLIIRQTMAHLVLNYELGWQKKEDWSRNQESWITHPDFLLRCVKKAV